MCYHQKMETKDFQKKCADIVDRIDRRYKVERDEQLTISQLIEEIGELAKDVNLRRLRNRDPEMDNLSGEFADVFLQFSNLAQRYGIDLEEAVENKIEKLKERGYLQ